MYTTYVFSTGKEHDAVFLPWGVVETILGHPHTGEPEEDSLLIQYLLDAGAPRWVTDAEGWTDAAGWGLIGPRSFRRYQVPASSVKDFLDRYYKPDRYTGRGDSYAASLLQTYEQSVTLYGFAFISRHDSITGEIVAYYKGENHNDETTN